MMKIELPQEVKNIINALSQAGFEAYAVGGCVRDVLRGVLPEDWDVTTNATPEQIQKIFPESFYENVFGTVGVRTGSESKNLSVVEITTYRTEEKYSDHRHPDSIRFAKTLEEDLARRDFTINALALSSVDGAAPQIIDPFGGQKDLESGKIKSVGDPDKRFLEDALRMLRAVRFASTFGFEIDPQIFDAIRKNSASIKYIAKERIRDEILKIISFTPKEWQDSKDDDRRYSNELDDTDVLKGPARAFILLHESGLLNFILPELEEGMGVSQHLPHRYDVWQHTLRAFTYSVKENFPVVVRLASLFHDIAKPRAKSGQGEESTFYNHDVLGAKIAIQVLTRLRFPKDIIEKVAVLVRRHMFSYDAEITTDSSVRRLMREVGLENFGDLIKLRLADRMATPVPKAEKYALRHLKARAEILSQDPISVTMLKINGHEVMKALGIEPGPKVGAVLNTLLEEVLDNPKKNSQEYLSQRIRELGSMTESELMELGRQARERSRKIEEEAEKKIKEKYYVK